MNENEEVWEQSIRPNRRIAAATNYTRIESLDLLSESLKYFPGLQELIFLYRKGQVDLYFVDMLMAKMGWTRKEVVNMRGYVGDGHERDTEQRTGPHVSNLVYEVGEGNRTTREVVER